MISHYPLATLLPWPAAPHHHLDSDCTLLLEGEGGVALQRYQARSPESSPRHWVSITVLLDSFLLFRCFMGSSASPAKQPNMFSSGVILALELWRVYLNSSAGRRE